MIKAVIFDYAGTIYNPQTAKPYPDVLNVLNVLKQKGLKFALVSRASDLEERLKELKDFNLKRYFQVLEIIPIGFEKEFNHILQKLNVAANECLVIGDRVKSEILEGNKIGAKTVWIMRGEFLDEKPKKELENPDYKINSLDEILTIDTILK